MSDQTRAILPKDSVDVLRDDIQLIIDTGTLEGVEGDVELLTLRYLKTLAMLKRTQLTMCKWFTPKFLDTFTGDLDAYDPEEYPGLTPELHEALYQLLDDARMEPYDSNTGKAHIRPLIDGTAYHSSQFYGHGLGRTEDAEDADPADDPEEI